MENCDFNNDYSFSKEYQPFFDEYYSSKAFYNKMQMLRKKGVISIEKQYRSEHPLFQQESYLDIIMQLNTGSQIRIDEKVNRCYDLSKEPNYPVEVFSNPTKGGKPDGWGYHIGTTMIQAKVNVEPKYFWEEPVIYTINNKFIDEVTRNNSYPIHPNKSTNGLYNSGYRWIPRYVLEKYWP